MADRSHGAVDGRFGDGARDPAGRTIGRERSADLRIQSRFSRLHLRDSYSENDTVELTPISTAFARLSAAMTSLTPREYV